MKIDWSSYRNRKLIDPKNLAAKISEIKASNKSIATLNGSFDLMHAGHLDIIFAGSLQADVLIVALNSDSSIKAYKSPSRPIIPLQYRIDMMAAIACIDYITWFDETDPRDVLEIIRPDVHVNGVEYGENCIEASTVKKNGGRLHLVPRTPGLATSAIINKIVDIEKKG